MSKDKIFNALKEKFDKNKNIVRVEKNKDNPYVVINKTCINDNSLTWAAKGLHSYLMSLPDDWIIYINELTKHTSCGRDHTYTVIKELLKFGYMEKIQYRYQGKVLGLSYTVFETPIDVTNYDNTKPRIVNMNVSDNGEIIENTTVQPFTESTDSATSDTADTTLLNNNNNKIITKQNNDSVVVVVSEKEKQLLEMYKSFKIEKRVMPHTLKLLKENADKFDLEVFEQIFISASEDSVIKKYAYIKTTLATLESKGIFTIGQYNDDQEQRKATKNKTKATGSSTSRSENTKSNKAPTRFHFNYGNESFRNFSDEELEKKLKESQQDKFNNDDVQANESESNQDLRAQAIKNVNANNFLTVIEGDPFWEKQIEDEIKRLSNN
ncbi:hypothetical protein SDC9_37740 [bioreactor metagenome]|uniref:DnaD domain-containing protein n=1 Tax=bioreactor metagenome TaxID=1076179 RepID=A0A644VJU0_9ZZZZ